MYSDPTKVHSEGLSAIIITKNEEVNISRCLQSLTFVDEVVLVDSGSTDKTLELARSFGNVKVIEAPWFGFVRNKEIAVEHASHNWIFWIDADEEVPTALCEEWSRFSISPIIHNVAACDLARKTFFLGSWVKHSGWYPNRTVRFFHKHKACFSQSVLHERVEPKIGYLKHSFESDLFHYSYTTLYQYFDKMNRYGAAGAREVIRRQKKVYLAQLFFQPLWTFFRFYFLKRGFLDGALGLVVCLGAAFSNFIKYTNCYFMQKSGYVEKEKQSKS